MFIKEALITIRKIVLSSQASVSCSLIQGVLLTWSLCPVGAGVFVLHLDEPPKGICRISWKSGWHLRRAEGWCRCWPHTGWWGTAVWPSGCYSISRCWPVRSKHFPFLLLGLHLRTNSDKIKSSLRECAHNVSCFEGYNRSKLLGGVQKWPFDKKIPFWGGWQLTIHRSIT